MDNQRGRWARGINRKLRREVLKQQNLLSPAHLLPHRNKIPNNEVHDERIQQTGKACIVRKQKQQEAEKEREKRKAMKDTSGEMLSNFKKWTKKVNKGRSEKVKLWHYSFSFKSACPTVGP